MQECQCVLLEKLTGEGICSCRLGKLPPIPDDFELTGGTFVAELEAFGLSVVIIGNLEKVGIYTVSGLREWLRSGERVEQIDVRKRAKIEAALAAAERWGK